MNNVDLNELYAVNPDVRLRNDRKYIVAARIELDSVSPLRLSPTDGAALSLFNGTRPCEEIIELCSSMTGSPNRDQRDEAREFVEKFIQRYIDGDDASSVPLLVNMADLSEENKKRMRIYNPIEYVIHRDAYQPDDWKLAAPIDLLWLITNQCPVSCQYCYMPRTPFKVYEMPTWKRIQELVHEAHRLGVVRIDLSGGDPLCHPQFFDLIELLAELDFSPFNLSTKSYISPSTAKRLAANPIVGSFQISLDSTVPEIADFMVQRPGFCERMVESLENALDAGLSKVIAKAVITPYNLPTIPKFYRDLKAMGVHTVNFSTYGRSGYHHDDKLFNYPDDFEWLEKQVEELSREFPDDEIYIQNGPPIIKPETVEERQEMWPNRSRCPAGRNSFTICANGRVVACEQMPEREEDYLGDLKVQSIEEVWDGEALDHYMVHPPKEKLAGTPCFDCEEYDDCQTRMGVCVRDCCIYYGTRWVPPPNCPKAPFQLRSQ